MRLLVSEENGNPLLIQNIFVRQGREMNGYPASWSQTNRRKGRGKTGPN